MGAKEVSGPAARAHRGGEGGDLQGRDTGGDRRSTAGGGGSAAPVRGGDARPALEAGARLPIREPGGRGVLVRRGRVGSGRAARGCPSSPARGRPPRPLS